MSDWETAPKADSDGWETAVGPKDIPGNPTAAELAARPAYKSPSIGARLLGAPEAAASTLSAIPAQILGRAAAAGTSLVSGPDRGAEIGRNIANALTYEPRSEGGQYDLEKLGRAMEASKLEGLGPNLGMTVARGAAAAPRAAGAALKAGREALPEVGVGGVPQAVDPTRALAATAIQKYDIPLRPDMLWKNKLAKMAGEAAEQIPLSGSKGDVRQAAFNRAVAQTIGVSERVDKLTPDVYAKAMNKAGETIGDISAKNPIPFNAELKTALEKHALNAEQFETSDVGKVVNSYLKELTDAGEAKGQIDGVAFRKIRTKLTSQMRRTNNGDLKHALSDLDDSMLDAIEGQLSPRELEQFTKSRMYYSNGKKIEPLIAKGTGDVSPAALMARVTSDPSGKSAMARGTGGDLGELARIGQRFLKEPPSSGTAERGLVYGGLLGGGAMIEPHTAAGLFGAANLYNRASPMLARRMTRGALSRDE